MIGYVIIGFLAAFGALCVLWILLGAWLTQPADRCIIVCPTPGREEALLRRYLWLRNLGLVKGMLTLVCHAPDALAAQYPAVEFVTLEQYLAQMIEEREKIDGS